MAPCRTHHAAVAVLLAPWPPSPCIDEWRPPCCSPLSLTPPARLSSPCPLTLNRAPTRRRPPHLRVDAGRPNANRHRPWLCLAMLHLSTSGIGPGGPDPTTASSTFPNPAAARRSCPRRIPAAVVDPGRPKPSHASRVSLPPVFAFPRFPLFLCRRRIDSGRRRRHHLRAPGLRPSGWCPA